MENEAKAIGIRLSEVLNKLKNLQKISGDADIIQKLGYKSKSSITEMKKGRSNVTPELLKLLRDDYNVSEKYILEGILPVFVDTVIIERNLEDILSRHTELITALRAAVKVLTLEIIENRVAKTKRPFLEVSLEIEKMMKDVEESDFDLWKSKLSKV